MSGFTIDQTVSSIVLTGEFNPTIFHPSWLAQNGLIADAEAEAAEALVCSNDISTFKLDGLHFQIERHRFGLTTKDDSQAVRIRDLTVGIFCILEHTPLHAMGLNVDLHFGLSSVAEWHSIGHSLAPKQPWRGVVDNPGMLGISVRGKRDQGIADRVDFRVQPTTTPKSIFVGVNQHYAVLNDERTAISARNLFVMRVLADDWSEFRNFAVKSSSQLLSNALCEEDSLQ